MSISIKKPTIPINIGIEKINKGHKIYQLIPDSTVTNTHCGDELIKSLHRANTSFTKRLKNKGKSFVYHTKNVVTYEIYLTKEEVKFTFSIPIEHDSFLSSKIKSNWRNIGVNPIDDYIQEFENDNSLTCKMGLEKHYFLQLLTDKRENAPLPSILNTLEGLKEDDKLLFQLMLEPVNNWWTFFCDQKYEEFRQGKDISNEASIGKKIWFFTFENILTPIIELAEQIIESFFDIDTPTKRKQEKNLMFRDIKIKTDKTQFDGFNTTINLYSYSKNSMRRRENLNSLIVALRTMDADNSLRAGKTKRVVKIKRSTGELSFLFPQILNTKELQQIISLPTKEKQKEYKQIRAIQSQQTKLPKRATSSNGFAWGQINNGGLMVDVNLSDLPDDVCKSKVLVCDQGGGKTTALQNFIMQCHIKKQPCIVLDYVKEYEMTREIEEHIPNAIIYDMAKYTSGEVIAGLGYNEVFTMIRSDDKRKRLDGSQYITTMVIKLLNGLTMGNTEKLSSPMLKYLSSACRVAFIHDNSTIMDIPQILSDVDIRESFISKAISSGVYKENHADIKNLKYLTIDKGEDSVGNQKYENRDSVVSGVLNRFASIESLDLNLIELFTNPIDTNIDFNKHIDNNDIVFIRIPQSKFPDETVRDILCTFFATKLWLCVQVRNNDKPTHLVFDEIKMIQNTTNFLSEYITQFRRYRLSTIFATHTLKQFSHAFDEVNASGLQLFILSGVKHDAIKMIEKDIKGFAWEEIQEMPKHHALCITSYDQQKYEFIAKMNDAFYKIKKPLIS